MRCFPAFAAVLGLLAAALFVPAAFSDTPQPVPATPTKSAPPAKADAKPPLQVKVFRLTRVEPGTVSAALESLLGPANDVKVEPMPMGGAVQGPLGFGGAGLGGAGLGGAGFGNAGCFLGSPAGQPLWRAAVNERTKAVIVRGSAKHLAIATDVVAVLDRAPNAAVPSTQNLQAFELKTATAAELTDVIEALAFEDVFTSAAAEKLLLVVAPAADQKVIADLVKNLDSDGKQDGE